MMNFKGNLKIVIRITRIKAILLKQKFATKTLLSFI